MWHLNGEISAIYQEPVQDLLVDRDPLSACPWAAVFANRPGQKQSRSATVSLISELDLTNCMQQGVWNASRKY